jgi:hypothetical protein
MLSAVLYNIWYANFSFVVQQIRHKFKIQKVELNKQYDRNDFQVDVPDSTGVSKIYLSKFV